ncbi:MAG TPA: hypothetical protein VGK61_09000 [Planctomycetota bacterium]|jgi:hypothetical protein
MDALLGRIAVDRGLITEAQLAKMLAKAGDGLEGERPLADVLKEMGLVDDRGLAELVDERERRVRAMGPEDVVTQDELEIGQLLVKHNRATQNQINKCLEIQEKLAREGRTPLPRLGELLVNHGYVDARTIDELLRLQRRFVMVCASCDRRINMVEFEEGRAYRCPSCGGPLKPGEAPDAPKAVGGPR